MIHDPKLLAALRALGFTGRTVDMAAALHHGQRLINSVACGRVIMHIGGKGILDVQDRASHWAWTDPPNRCVDTG